MGVIAHPDPPLRDGNVALRPFTLADGPWLADLVARLASDSGLAPDAPLHLFGKAVTLPMSQLAGTQANLVQVAAKRLDEMWKTGRRATFIIDADRSSFGVIWVALDGIVGGFRIPPEGSPLPMRTDGVLVSYDDETNTLAEPLTIARAIRLMVEWARTERRILVTPRLGFPCRNPQLVAWAERHGLEWAPE